MTTVNPSRHKCCALCNRWQGDAELTSSGTSRGMVRFNTSKRGTCTVSRNTRISNEGTNCNDFQISQEASSYAL